MKWEQFEANLALVLAHTLLLETKGAEPLGEAWSLNIGAQMIGAFAGYKPEVPDFKGVNAARESSKAIATNVANFGDISKLAGNVNAFNQSQLDAMMEHALPGYKSMVGDITSNISGFLKGEVPRDVSEAIGRNGAWQSMSGGYGGSGMARNLVARDLGMTSLDLMEKGVDAGSRWLATARQSLVAPQFDPSSMFLTPEQQIQTKMFNTAGKFQRDWLSEQVKRDNDPFNQISQSAQQTESSL